MPGSGKSTLGKNIASYLNLPYCDLDDLIEVKEEKEIRTIFTQNGEDYFRLSEHSSLKDFLSNLEKGKNQVLSLGGGTPCFHDNMELINNYGVSLFIDTPLDVIADRMLLDGEISKRPIIAKAGSLGLKSELDDKYKYRLSFYEKAHIKIKGDESLEFISSLIKSFVSSNVN